MAQDLFDLPVPPQSSADEWLTFLSGLRRSENDEAPAATLTDSMATNSGICGKGSSIRLDSNETQRCKEACGTKSELLTKAPPSVLSKSASVPTFFKLAIDTADAGCKTSTHLPSAPNAAPATSSTSRIAGSMTLALRQLKDIIPTTAEISWFKNRAKKRRRQEIREGKKVAWKQQGTPLYTPSTSMSTSTRMSRSPSLPIFRMSKDRAGKVMTRPVKPSPVQMLLAYRNTDGTGDLPAYDSHNGIQKTAESTADRANPKVQPVVLLIGHPVVGKSTVACELAKQLAMQDFPELYQFCQNAKDVQGAQLDSCGSSFPYWYSQEGPGIEHHAHGRIVVVNINEVAEAMRLADEEEKRLQIYEKTHSGSDDTWYYNNSCNTNYYRRGANGYTGRCQKNGESSASAFSSYLYGPRRLISGCDNHIRATDGYDDYMSCICQSSKRTLRKYGLRPASNLVDEYATQPTPPPPSLPMAPAATTASPTRHHQGSFWASSGNSKKATYRPPSEGHLNAWDAYWDERRKQDRYEHKAREAVLRRYVLSQEMACQQIVIITDCVYADTWAEQRRHYELKVQSKSWDSKAGVEEEEDPFLGEYPRYDDGCFYEATMRACRRPLLPIYLNCSVEEHLRRFERRSVLATSRAVAVVAKDDPHHYRLKGCYYSLPAPRSLMITANTIERAQRAIRSRYYRQHGRIYSLYRFNAGLGADINKAGRAILPARKSTSTGTTAVERQEANACPESGIAGSASTPGKAASDDSSSGSGSRDSVPSSAASLAAEPLIFPGYTIDTTKLSVEETARNSREYIQRTRRGEAGNGKANRRGRSRHWEIWTGWKFLHKP